jgi:hydrogenase expression/formation protein HypE
MDTKNKIRMGHGSGGLLSGLLIKRVVLKYFKNEQLKKLEDAAALTMEQKNIAFTTDSYVIDPLFFPGGDIGKLSVFGTVNDLAMKGARPNYISLSLIIEEGFSIGDLETILKSAALAARQAGVTVVCGDTKVVERGKTDRLFINTAGIGSLRMNLHKENIKIGDAIMVSGTIGDHGIAVMNERLKLGLRSSIKSDCAPLNLLTRKLERYKGSIHYMRDPTRGGIVSVLNEIIDDTPFGIMLDERTLPIRKEVGAACEILGIDPLYVANEGKCIALVSKKRADSVLKTMRSHALGRHAAIIGEVVEQPDGVWLKTAIGGTHPLHMLEAEGLPRIC